MVKGISHVNEAVVNFNVGLVYLVNIRSHVNYFPRLFSRFYGFIRAVVIIIIAVDHGSISCYVEN